MFSLLSALASLGSCFRSRAALQIEILALRHQLTVMKRSQSGRVRLGATDRLLWVCHHRFTDIGGEVVNKLLT